MLFFQPYICEWKTSIIVHLFSGWEIDHNTLQSFEYGVFLVMLTFLILEIRFLGVSERRCNLSLQRASIILESLPILVICTYLCNLFFSHLVQIVHSLQLF